MAEALAPAGERAAATAALTKVATPASRHHRRSQPPSWRGADRHRQDPAGTGRSHEHGKQAPVIALVLRGDHELNEIKAEKLPGVANPLTFANDEQIKAPLGCDARLHRPGRLPVASSSTAAPPISSDFVCGANETGFHLTGANWDRDIATYEVADLRNVVEGDPSPDGQGTLLLKRGIEVGHIFQLGPSTPKP
jgi:prolyl-tRNA synthetase